MSHLQNGNSSSGGRLTNGISNGNRLLQSNSSSSGGHLPNDNSSSSEGQFTYLTSTDDRLISTRVFIPLDRVPRRLQQLIIAYTLDDNGQVSEHGLATAAFFAFEVDVEVAPRTEDEVVTAVHQMRLSQFPDHVNDAVAYLNQINPQEWERILATPR